ncbi:MAG: hypothetical protein J7M26_06875, partial [Armatimonadetes bacterium]|nr:hypothetical protein [Armatimonadota bacterium]
MSIFAVLTILTTSLAAAPGSGAGEYRATGQQVIVETPAYRCTLDASTGVLVNLAVPEKGTLAIGKADGNLWRLGFRDNTWLGAAQAARMKPLQRHWDATAQTLTLTWSAPQAEVRVALTARHHRLILQAQVKNLAKQPALRLTLPAELAFPAKGLRLLTWPVSTGLGLTRQWLELPQGKAPSRWEDQPLAGRLFRRLTGMGAKMLDLPGTPRPVRVTEEGARVLGRAVTARLQGGLVTVLRPPDGEADAVLLENDDGPYLAGFHLGGKGWFAYFCGRTDERVALPVVPALLKAWAPPDRPKVGLISLRGRGHGGWMAVTVGRWEEVLPSALRGKEVVRLRSAEAVARALKDDSFAAIFNPYAEHLPADTPQQAEAIIDALKQFVRAGGLWLDGGAYPLYYITRPARFGRFADNYPPVFADFVHLDSDYGQLALYRTQPEDQIFVPARLELAGAE